MQIRTLTKAGFYKDSVALMRVAEALLKQFPLQRATLVMATPANKDILTEAGLLEAHAAKASPADLLIVLAGDNPAVVDAAGLKAEELLNAKPPQSGSAQQIVPKSLAMAVARQADEALKANLAQISVPGIYAAGEALKAVRQGLHVFLFSDNVPLEHEVIVKQAAQQKGVLVMGPDCGTAIINGVPLGFANVVRRGSIGFVAASGTGLQEVTTGVHNAGAGVSHALGTGGRDLYAEVGGITMLQGLDLLIHDADTKVIGIVSKPPAPSVTKAVLRKLQDARKPAVVLFLGASDTSPAPHIRMVRTLEGATALCAALARGDAPTLVEAEQDDLPKVSFKAGQRYLRGLYSGGTFCTEAQLLARELGMRTWSNVPLEKNLCLTNLQQSQEHTMIDLGDDDFTVGKPHPMIDQTTRIERLLQEARDPEVAVILLDLVLGYGAHADPAGELVPHLNTARELAQKDGRTLCVVAFACGTEEDPQVRSAQERKLLDAGCLLAVNSSQAARLAVKLVNQIAAAH